MTSMLSEEDSKVARMKQKLMNDVHVKEETRSFLSVFRENLSISPSDLEQGFNKHRFRPNKNTILSVTALLIALLCLSLESWKFHCSLINAREIEELKRSVESLKHRFVKEDLLNELKAFEEQLYTEMYNDDDDDDDDDPDEADIDNADYDSNYDDDTFSSHDYSPVFGARPSDIPDSSSTIAPVPSPPELSTDKTLLKLATAHKIEVKYNQESVKSYKNVDRQRHQEKKVLEGKLENHENNTKRKRDVLGTDKVKDHFLNWKMSLKRKRSIDEENHNSKRSFVRRHSAKNHAKGTVASSSGSREMLHDRSIDDQQNTSIVVSSRHPPKKYNTHSSLDNTDASPSKHNKITVQGVTNHSAKISHKFRKNMNLSRKIVAIHFDGDRSKASGSDYYAGNGRIRHGGSTFKAWKPSDWVTDLGMGEYFSMSDDGNVTIYETGLYLVYAQIHYNDDHDEIGFHLVVNGRPILQCMIDNSGHSRNISQTCFSAQLTRLKKQDVLVFKEASSPRFAIFDKENSFFGLVKLGELRRPSQ